MEDHGKIEPHRITKPIQLLAAWLLGLIIVNGAFLIAAARITSPGWVPGALVIACIVNVPLFLFSIFLLQTKFRPEMQEDAFYSKYLESKTGNTEIKIAPESVASIREDVAVLEKVVAEIVPGEGGEVNAEKTKWSSVTVMLNENLSFYSSVAEKLSSHGIPVHETFGAGVGKPESFYVAVGDGFNRNQIISLVDALSSIRSGWIGYAEGEGRADEYEDRVLIGAYGRDSCAVKFDKIKPLIQREDITDLEIYKMLGRRERLPR